MTIEQAIQKLRTKYYELMETVDVKAVRGLSGDTERKAAFVVRVNIEHLGGKL